MDTFGRRLREERERIGLNQAAFGEIVGVKKNAQIHYEADRRSPSGSYLMAASAAGVDIYYVLTGQRLPANGSYEPSRIEKIDPLLFRLCADVVAGVYKDLAIRLTRSTHWGEAIWAYNELLSRVADPTDGDEVEATLPQIAHLQRKRLQADD